MAVMTDKATVEIPSPGRRRSAWLGAEVGETLAVGSPIVRLKVAGEGMSGPAMRQRLAAGLPLFLNPLLKGEGDRLARRQVPVYR